MKNKFFKIIGLITLIFPLFACGSNRVNDINVPKSQQIDYLFFAVNNTNYEAYVTRMVDDKGKIYYYNQDVVNIPESIMSNNIEYKVTGIMQNAFENNPFIKEVILHDNMTVVGHTAFKNCHNLSNVVLGENLVALGDYAFENTYALKNVKFGNKLERINNGVFTASGIEKIVFSDSIKEIGINAFFNCQQLEEITFGANLTSLEGSAFERCNKLKIVTFQNKIESIGDYSFRYDSNIESINFPSSIKYIGKYAFEGAKISELKIKADECIVAEAAFINNKSLTRIDISAKSLNAQAFYNCSKLVEINLDNIEFIGWKCFKNTAIKKVIFPTSLKTIGDSAFSDLKSLIEVTFNNGLEVIEYGAFNNCSNLKGEITLPSSLTRIMPQAFLNTSYSKINISKITQYYSNSFDKDMEIQVYDNLIQE